MVFKYGLYEEVSTENLEEFNAQLMPSHWSDRFKENPLLTSKRVKFTFENGFIHEQ